jgi:predicted nucleic acid-binding Zn ribbon protein
VEKEDPSRSIDGAAPAPCSGKPFRAMAEKTTLTPLKDILAELLKSADLPFNPEDGLIWRVWDEVVGEAVARNAQPLWVKNKRLRIKVSDPIWLQELTFMEENMRNRLNARLGRKAVERIEFRLRSR